MIRDIQFGLKLLWKDRGYAATAILTLAICIGANTAIFAIVHSVLLRPLPVPDSDRILLMSNQYPNATSEMSIDSGVPDYYDRLRNIDVFEEQAMYVGQNFAFDIEGDRQMVHGMRGTPSLFRLLKVHPVRGRLFDDSEGQIANEMKVILSYGLWQQLFAGADAIGQEIRMGVRKRTIVGVMPPGFQFVDPEARFWVPLAFTDQQKSDDARHSNNWVNIGRLKPGATIQQAQQEVNALNAANLEEFPQFKKILTNAGFHTGVDRLQDVIVRNVRSTLYLLWGGAAFVLLIGAVNIANLALARSNLRMKELSTRLAIGASRGQVARQLVIESLMLALAGGLGGILSGFGILRALGNIGLARLPRANEIQMDATVIAATLAVATIAGILVGLVPVAHLFKVNLSTALNEENRTGTGSRKARAVRRVLVVAQVAFAFVLLMGSGLLVASFRNLLFVDAGFKTDGVLTTAIWMPDTSYPDTAAVHGFTNRLLETIHTIPRVSHAGATTILPLSGNHNDNWVILAEGYQMKPGESIVSPMRAIVTPDYFEAMGTPLLRGRNFDERDANSAPGVVIVDERLAQKFWPGMDPIGRRMYEPSNPKDLAKTDEHTRFRTVVGVVRDVRLEDLSQPMSTGVYYYPVSQWFQRGISLAIKTNGNPTAVLPALRAKVGELDPFMLLMNVQTMDEYAALSLMPRRTEMVLAASFGIVSLFLSAIGIYGVLAFLVTQRSREIGIRIALGSTKRGIFALVVREGVVLVAGGLCLGVAGTLGLQQVLESQIYGLGAMDPIVMGTVLIVLALIALTASSLPARRATRVDPVTVLNQQ